MVYSPNRRVVITGLGVVAPNGIGKEDFWNACICGYSGIRSITRFDASPLSAQIAGEVPDLEPEAFNITQEESLSTDRSTQFALAAANMALQDAGFTRGVCEAERNRTGVYIGSAMDSIEEGDKLWIHLTDHGAHLPDYTMDVIVPPALLMTHSPAAAIAAHHHLYGPCRVISTACSAGTDAIGEAFWSIQEGQADCMLAGGTDAAISYGGLAVFCIMGAVSINNEVPERASRPYDKERDGFVLAEGAGILVLEEREHALARNAHIYAELVAYASNSNMHHMTALPLNGVPLQQLIRQALDEAEIAPQKLGYINSHGSSTLLNEIVETAAYKAVFGEQAYRIPISATKSMIGHSQGAAGAIEAIVTALVLEHQIIPPTINQEHADPVCDLDYVPNVAREATVHVALTHSSGFGGVNSALILARSDWIDRQ